jgi:NADH dehydrogenase
VSADTGRWVVRSLEKRRARIHLNTQLRSAENGHVVLSTGEEFGSELIVWTAGNAANPIIARHTDLPTDGRGLLRVRADLRVGTDTAPVPDAWAIGDNAAVPDLASKIPGATTVPNAQHAVRQAKRLAANILATIRGRGAKNCVHHNLGVVATLGLGQGVFQSGRVVIKGFAAWVMHRGYHVLAIPSWERKIRVLAVWFTADVFGRDIVSLMSVQHPRDAFVAGGAPRARSIADFTAART